jgi:DNA-binding MarR family transcriptional regulator
MVMLRRQSRNNGHQRNRERYLNARLARAAFVTAQTMQGILANLERDGLIRRPPDPSHGKILRNELTDRGRKLLAKAHVAARVVEDRMVASFGEKAADQLAAALSKCADDLTAALERDGASYATICKSPA